MYSFSFYSLFLILSFVFSNNKGLATVRGIYVNQQSIHSTKKLNFLIKMAKSTMINTFVVDLHRMTDAYEKNISLLKEANIGMYTRIIVFPGGGNEQQIHSREYIKKRIELAQQAARLGSKVIQLDYIRYSTKRKKSPDNAKDILSVIQQFKEAESISQLPLHIAFFGEALYSASTAIGQDIPFFQLLSMELHLCFILHISNLIKKVHTKHIAPFTIHSQL
ncbi:MAG: hypothetical protein AB8G05_03125 [Oligoflexales bacterium]